MKKSSETLRSRVKDQVKLVNNGNTQYCLLQRSCQRPHHTGKSRTLRREQALDQLYLIAYYGRAILYNSPYDTPEFGIRDIAEAVSRELATNPGHFHKIFLFSPIEKENKVFQVWPVTG